MTERGRRRRSLGVEEPVSRVDLRRKKEGKERLC